MKSEESSSVDGLAVGDLNEMSDINDESTERDLDPSGIVLADRDVCGDLGT